jgi:hypothetical protein
MADMDVDGCGTSVRRLEGGVGVDETYVNIRG